MNLCVEKKRVFFTIYTAEREQSSLWWDQGYDKLNQHFSCQIKALS